MSSREIDINFVRAVSHFSTVYIMFITYSYIHTVGYKVLLVLVIYIYMKFGIAMSKWHYIIDQFIRLRYITHREPITCFIVCYHFIFTHIRRVDIDQI